MGKDAVDLMTATETDVTYEGGGTMAPVLLAFKHELAQVKLTVRTGEKQAEVSDIRLFGVDYKGDLLWTPENSTWQNRVNCTKGVFSSVQFTRFCHVEFSGVHNKSPL